jgi:4a-hydroxytetrahydrobiopterin dehydratase
VLFWGAYAHYRTRNFSDGARLVAVIAELAEEIGHYPDIDLRPDGVTIRTFSRDDGALSVLDIELARRVSTAAGELGLEPDPSQLQAVGIAVAQGSGMDVRPFWTAALGYKDLPGAGGCDRPAPTQPPPLVS